MAVRFEPTVQKQTTDAVNTTGLRKTSGSRKAAGAHQRSDAKRELATVTDLESRRSALTGEDQEPAHTYAELEDLAVRAIARKARSEQEVLRLLREAGADDETSAEICAELVRKQYLNDDLLAETLTEYHLTRKRSGPSVIRRALEERRLHPASIQAALERIDDEDQLLRVLEAATDRARRMGSLERPVAERRLSAYLQRRGYSSGHIREAVQRALDSVAHPEQRPGTVRFLPID